jgi:hypothetical protein
VSDLRYRMATEQPQMLAEAPPLRSLPQPNRIDLEDTQSDSYYYRDNRMLGRMTTSHDFDPGYVFCVGICQKNINAFSSSNYCTE